jgi:hypothetical protein
MLSLEVVFLQLKETHILEMEASFGVGQMVPVLPVKRSRYILKPLYLQW